MKEVIADSITSFIDEVFSDPSGKVLSHDIADIQMLYRGQSNKEWKPLPSAFRSREDFLCEHIYLKEFRNIAYEECRNCSSFEIIAKAQHYGVPTRLLDVTSNPLVALFFACNDGQEFENDGAVYLIGPTGMFSHDELFCMTIADYVLKYKIDQYWDDRWGKALVRSVQHSDGRHFVADPSLILDQIAGNRTKCLAVDSGTSNPRIRAQQASFVLCTTPCVEDGSNHAGGKKFLFPDETGNLFEDLIGKRIVIPASAKRNLLVQLDCLGVNEATLFPDLEHQSRTAVARVRAASPAFEARSCDC